MDDERYMGFRTEGEYHEYYTLHSLLERETSIVKARQIKQRIKEIESGRIV